MPKIISIKRYVQAIYEIARDANAYDVWKTNLKRIVELAQDSEFSDLMENPKIPFDLKAKLAEQKLGKVSPSILNLVYVLISKDKLKYIDQISKEYEMLLDEYNGIRHAEVTTATPIDDAEMKSISNKLESFIGGKVTIHARVDPALIGGTVIRIGDSLIDGSIRNRLDSLKRELIIAQR
ncbi:MAG TPA: hypothetical protein DCX22_00545 [Dehalococcoidia bacterium]|nr:hypothetical protein [Dehalococcoidia bacterium]